MLLTPGVYNSAYFEHSFLAQQMGVELVEGRDLVVSRTTSSTCAPPRAWSASTYLPPHRRRLLDPLSFRPDSMLGVPGLMEAYRAGSVALANAPGTGIADDKAIYAYVPEIIQYYLSEDPILPNVPTYLCWPTRTTSYVLDHIDELVVKAANESGGYGMLSGPHSTQRRARGVRSSRSQADPRNYIAQPTLRCRARPSSSTTTSKAATSTCGPTSSTAKTSTCCPAA